jgi:hypothetical protein
MVQDSQWLYLEGLKPCGLHYTQGTSLDGYGNIPTVHDGTHTLREISSQAAPKNKQISIATLDPTPKEHHLICLPARLALACTLAISLSSHALSFGSKDDEPTIKVEKSDALKGQTTLALGAFRVAFVTEDSAVSTSHGAFSGGGSAAKMTGQLSGIDHATMQKIADEVYSDFLKQAAAKGYIIVDSNKVASGSAAYRDLVPTVNFADSRIGTLVIPTGQRSVAIAADDSGKDSKGSGSLSSAFHNLGKSTAKSEANKAFPLAAKDLGAPVLGVTIVVNFATFKGTSSSFGSSKASIAPGATIDGTNKNDLALFTSILAWDAKSCEYVGCMARVILQGYIHSDAPIGKTDTYGKWGMGNSTSKTAMLEADPDLYEKGVLNVTAQASAMMLGAMQKEK